MKVYLAGPMRGLPNLNFEAFTKAAEQLRNQGHEVYNPAAANLDGLPLKQIMAHVLWWLCHEAEAVAFLPGWRKSGGARIEFLIAKYLGYTIIKL